MSLTERHNMQYQPKPLDDIPSPNVLADIHTLLLLIEALDLTNLRPEWVTKLYDIRRRYPWPES